LLGQFNQRRQQLDSTAHEVNIDYGSFDPIIFTAIAAGDLGHVETLLTCTPTLANAVDIDGCSVLEWAARDGKLELVRLLLDFRADPNGVGPAWGFLQHHPISTAVFGASNVHHGSETFSDADSARKVIRALLRARANLELCKEESRHDPLVVSASEAL